MSLEISHPAVRSSHDGYYVDFSISYAPISSVCTIDGVEIDLSTFFTFAPIRRRARLRLRVIDRELSKPRSIRRRTALVTSPFFFAKAFFADMDER